MIAGLGLDLAEIARLAASLERFGDRLIQRLLTPGEQERLAALAPARQATFLASRFAAKEAAVKALGTGFAENISPLDVEVVSEPSGRPRLRLHGQAAVRAAALGVSHTHLTLTHTNTTAAAVVILETSSTIQHKD